MYINDLAEFAHVLLAMTEMLFNISISWLHVQLILFSQLADITENQQQALIELHYWHLKPTLIQHSCLLITEFKKRFLNQKNTYRSFSTSCMHSCFATLLSTDLSVAGIYFESQRSTIIQHLCSILVSFFSECCSGSGPSSHETSIIWKSLQLENSEQA